MTTNNAQCLFSKGHLFVNLVCCICGYDLHSLTDAARRHELEIQCPLPRILKFKDDGRFEKKID